MRANRLPFIITILIVIILAFFSYKEVRDSFGGKEKISIDYCKIDGISSYDDLSICDSLTDEEIEEASKKEECPQEGKCIYDSLSLAECCYAYKNNIPLSPDIYTIFFAMINSNLMYPLPVYICALILIPALYSLNKLFRSKYVQYYIQRKNYGSFLIKMLKRVYKYALIIPILYGIVYLLTLTLTNHDANEFTGVTGLASFGTIHYQTPGFILLFIINATLIGLVIINIGLIFIRSNRKLIFTIIESYIVYFVLLLIVEGLSLPDSFNLWLVGDTESSIYMHIICTSIYFLISFIVMFILYKDKEKTLTILGGGED